MLIQPQKHLGLFLILACILALFLTGCGYTKTWVKESDKIIAQPRITQIGYSLEEQEKNREEIRVRLNQVFKRCGNRIFARNAEKLIQFDNVSFWTTASTRDERDAADKNDIRFRGVIRLRAADPNVRTKPGEEASYSIFDGKAESWPDLQPFRIGEGTIPAAFPIENKKGIWSGFDSVYSAPTSSCEQLHEGKPAEQDFTRPQKALEIEATTQSEPWIATLTSGLEFLGEYDEVNVEFVIKVTKFDSANGHIDGLMTWPEYGAIRRIEGWALKDEFKFREMSELKPPQTEKPFKLWKIGVCYKLKYQGDGSYLKGTTLTVLLNDRDNDTKLDPKDERPWPILRNIKGMPVEPDIEYEFGHPGYSPRSISIKLVPQKRGHLSVIERNNYLRSLLRIGYTFQGKIGRDSIKFHIAYFDQNSGEIEGRLQLQQEEQHYTPLSWLISQPAKFTGTLEWNRLSLKFSDLERRSHYSIYFVFREPNVLEGKIYGEDKFGGRVLQGDDIDVIL